MGLARIASGQSAVGAPVAGFPVAVRAGHLMFMSGRMGLDHASGYPLRGYADLGRKPAPALGLLAPDSWEETFVAQAARMYEDMATLLAEHGAAPSDLLFYSIYMRAMRNFPLLARTRAALFAGGVAPPSTASQVPGLLHPDAVVYFDPVAIVPDPGLGLVKRVLTSRHVVQGPLSNYELATRAGAYGFYAGVVGAHPQNGVIVRGAEELNDAAWVAPEGGLAERRLLEPISAQTHTIYRLLQDMLEEHGAGLDRLLRLNLYLRDMKELPEAERVGRRFFPRVVPAGTAIGVESLARSDFLIEIEGITVEGATLRPAPRQRRVASWGRYVDAVRGGDLVFVSGLVGCDAASGKPCMHPDDLCAAASAEVKRLAGGSRPASRAALAAAAQARAIVDQLAAVLDALDSSLARLLKITVYLRDMADFPLVREVLLSRLGDDPPAITALAVADLPMPGTRLQIEAVAL